MSEYKNTKNLLLMCPKCEHDWENEPVLICGHYYREGCRCHEDNSSESALEWRCECRFMSPALEPDGDRRHWGARWRCNSCFDEYPFPIFCEHCHAIGVSRRGCFHSNQLYNQWYECDDCLIVQHPYHSLRDYKYRCEGCEADEGDVQVHIRNGQRKIFCLDCSHKAESEYDGLPFTNLKPAKR